MSDTSQSKRSIPLFLSVFVLASLALSHRSHAVSPPPDGGYPGGNTAEGQTALLSLTTGTFNTALGFYSLRANASGNFNTATGAGALLANSADNNTATGAGALLSNGTGDFNTANGAFALVHNTSGMDNTGIGGYALESNTIGMSNTAIGFNALPANTMGNNNTALGIFALWNNTTGSGNIALGPSALFNNRTGSNNLALGLAAGTGVMTASNVICIGIPGADVNDSFYVGNVFETSIDPDNLPVRIDFTGRLGTQSSSRRFKCDIKPMDEASQEVLALKPVIFHYKNEATCSLQFGLIAEEVADVDPNLVVRDKEGKPYSVRYDQVNAMLLNEFLKEHQKVGKLEATVAQQQRNFELAVTELKAQIQKVSAQLELSKSVAQTVLNSQ